MNVSPIKIALHVNMETYEIALVNIVCCDRYLLQFIQTSPPYLVQLESSLSIFALCSVQSFHLCLGQADEKVKRHALFQAFIQLPTNCSIHQLSNRKQLLVTFHHISIVTCCCCYCYPLPTLTTTFAAF